MGALWIILLLELRISSLGLVTIYTQKTLTTRAVCIPIMLWSRKWGENAGFLSIAKSYGSVSWIMDAWGCCAILFLWDKIFILKLFLNIHFLESYSSSDIFTEFNRISQSSCHNIPANTVTLSQVRLLLVLEEQT